MKYGVKNSATENDTIDVYIYSDIADDITATLYGEYKIEVMSAAKFQRLLDEKKDAKQINVYINSSGGDVMDGVAIYSQLKRHKAHITAYIDGWACSIASVIPMGADEVIMSDASMMMIHHPWTAAAGNADEFRKIADKLDSILEGSIIPAYKGKCGDKISDSELRDFLKEEKMLTAKECLQYGFCDEIMKKKSAENEAKDAVKETQNQAKISFMNRLNEMYASLKPSVLMETEKAESHETMTKPVDELHTCQSAILAQAMEDGMSAGINDANAVENAENAAEKQQDDVTDNNNGNINDNGSEPTKDEKTPEPAEDKAKVNEYFMKLLKGEI